MTYPETSLHHADLLRAYGGRAVRLAGVVALALALGASTPAFAADAVVRGVDTSTQDGTTVVRIQLSGVEGTPSVSPFRQGDPERLVLDIAGASVDAEVATTSAGLVSNVATANQDGMARVTLSLSKSATWKIATEGDVVVVTLKAGAVEDPLASALGAGSDLPSRLSGPQASADVALTTLDFQQRDRTSRVILGVRGAEASITQPQAGVIVVDIPGAQIPQSLKRELDTRFFQSAVDSVRATATKAGTRVTVRLRAGAEYAVKKEGPLTVLEVQVPGDVVAPVATALQNAGGVQSADPAAPSTPETSGEKVLGNATGKETLITGSGRKVDPQAVFGSGGGAQAPGGFSFATDVGSATDRASDGRRMSIDLQEADIHTVFRFIADFAEVNIVASDEVQGKVTVRLKDVPWDEALGAVLQAKGLGAQRLGNILRVAPIDKIKSEQQAAVEAKKAVSELADLTVYVAPLNYASALDVEKQVASLLSERGSVQVDTRGNQLIIKDVEERVAQVRELLKHLDSPNREVDIEARFVEASSNFTRSLGIQWGSNVDASATTGYPTGAMFPSDVKLSGGIAPATGNAAFYSQGSDNLIVDLGAAGSAGAVSFALGSIPGLVDINARLSAIQSEGFGRVVSNPHVRTLDNEEARVSQGARIPFVSVSQGGTQVQFIQAALELAVTPHITTDGGIFLDIQLTNNRPDFGNTVQGNPAIQTKEITTSVLVADGDTTVLGGVYATTESESERKVPFLGSIPFLGAFFKSTLREKSQNEMLVFITPRIVPVATRAASGS